jgi:oligopeptide/dipeptide ABC transporter ATP-binding protein
MSPAPILRVAGLRTEFTTPHGTVRAVRDVSFDIAPGERVGIVGESGSGKSAMALSLLGLIDPPGRVVGGSVKLGDRELVELSDRELQRVRGKEISLIYQDPTAALDPVKSIGHQLMESIRQHDRSMSRQAARRRAVELLADVEVPQPEKRLDDYPHQYSGGMRQRVMIASALANEPSLIIADEPTTALDVTTQAQVLELLNRLVTERNTAVLLITHNLGIVAEFCDTVRVMYAGRLVEQADTRPLFRAPAHPYSQALLSSVPRADRLQSGPLPAIGGAPPDLAALPEGCAFEPRCPLGHGRERCVTVAPPNQAPAVGRLSECHYAAEQLERGAQEVGAR